MGQTSGESFVDPGAKSLTGPTRIPPQTGSVRLALFRSVLAYTPRFEDKPSLSGRAG